MKLHWRDYLTLAFLMLAGVLTAINFYSHQTIQNIVLFAVVVFAMVGFVVAKSK
jgi:hypothetical protein